MIKTFCFRAVTLLWAFSLLFPMQRLQHIKWTFIGFRVPVYYLLISIPTLCIVLFVFAQHRPKKAWQWAFWLFPLVCLPGFWFGLDGLWSARQWLSLWMRGLACGAALASLIDSGESAQRMVRWIYPVGIAACLFGLVEMTFNINPLTDDFVARPVSAHAPDNTYNLLYREPGDYSGSSRPRGPQGNRIPYTACLVPFAPLALWRVRRHWKQAGVHCLAFAALLALILWSQTRTSWVSLSISVATYLVLIARKRIFSVVGIAGGIVVFLLISFSIPQARVFMREVAQSFDFNEPDIRHRLGSLPALRYLKHKPLFGAGYGNYPQVYRPYYTGPYISLDSPDNQYVRWLIETGALGFLGFIGFLTAIAGASLRRIYAFRDPEQEDFYQAVFAGWLGIAATFLFFDGFLWIGPTMTFWCLLGILSTCLYGDHEKLRL